MRIKTRLLLLVTSVAVAVSVTLVGLFLTERSINDALSSGQRAHTLVRQVSDLNNLCTEINIADISRVQRQWHLKVTDVLIAIKAYENSNSISVMLTELEQLNITFDQMVKILQDEQRPEFTGNYVQARYFLWHRFSVLLQSLVSQANHIANSSYEHIHDVQIKRNSFFVIMAVFWVVAVVVWSFTLWKGFVAPLKGMLRAVHAVGQGELGYRIPIKSNDSEMNGLIISFNSMMDRLQNLTVSRKRLIDAAEQERSRIGRELHDGICQAMAGARLQIDVLQCADKKASEARKKISTLLQQTLNETRRIVKDLRPIMLDELGLLATLSWLQDQNRGVVELMLHSSLKESAIPTRLKTPVFRIVQEALNNAIMHGQSSKVYVQITSDNNALDLSIEDDGRGFRLSESKTGSGLVNIRERVAAEQGEMSIDTKPGKGCCLLISFPLNG